MEKMKAVAGPRACVTCKCYVTDPNVPNVGECRADTPKVVDASRRAAWPIVDWDAVCAKHDHAYVRDEG